MHQMRLAVAAEIARCQTRRTVVVARQPQHCQKWQTTLFEVLQSLALVQKGRMRLLQAKFSKLNHQRRPCQ